MRQRQESEAQTLASLTGWEIGTIRGRLDLPRAAPAGGKDEPWWKKIWN